MDLATIAGVAGLLLTVVGLYLAYQQLKVARDRAGEPPRPVVAAPGRRRGPYLDWGAALERGPFEGRTGELAQILDGMVADTISVAALTGPAGIGKSRLALESAHRLATHQPQRYDVVLWRSLKDGMTFTILVSQLLSILSRGNKVSSGDPQADLAELAALLRKVRLLLVLDNAESILDPGPVAGQLAPGFAAYESLFGLFISGGHRSSLVITGRELPEQFNRSGALVGGPVRIMRLSGMDPQAAAHLIAQHSVHGSPEVVQQLCRRMDYNPLKLRLAASSAAEVFGGDLGRYLASVDKSLAAGEVGQLVFEQLARTDQVSRDVLHWLAVERGPVTVEALHGSMLHHTEVDLASVLATLFRRSMIERTDPGTFTLQPAVAEYLMGDLVRLLTAEIEAGTPLLLHRLALLNPQAPLFLQEAQFRYGIHALLRACGADVDRDAVLAKFDALFGVALRDRPKRSYLVGNLINLMTGAHASLDNRDLSNVEIRRADLSQASVRGADFSGSHFDNCTFYQALTSIHAIAPGPDNTLLAVGGSSGDIWVLRRDGLTEVVVLTGHTDWIRGIAFHPTEPLLFSVSDDETVRVWDYREGWQLHCLRRHEGKVTALAYDPGRHLLYSVGEDGMLLAWSGTDWRLSFAVKVSDYALWAVALSPDGTTLALGGEDNAVQLWDCAGHRPLKQLVGSTDWTTALAFRLGSGQLVSGGRDGVVRVWDVDTGQIATQMPGFGEWIWTLDCARLAIVAGYGDGTIRLWRDVDRPDGLLGIDLTGHTKRAWCVRFFPDELDLVSGGEDHAVRVWNVASGDCVGSITGSISPLFTIDARLGAADGDIEILAGGEDGMLRMWRWDGTTATMVYSAPAHRGRVWATLFDRDGGHVITSGEDGIVRRWAIPIEPDGNHILATLGEQIWAVELLGSLIAAAGEEHIFLVDRATGEVSELSGVHRGWTWCLASTRDGRYLATGSYDKTVGWWDVTTRTLQAILKRHRAPIVGLAWSEQTGRLLTGGYEGEVRIWDPNSGECVDTQRVHDGPIWSATTSPSGLRFATACGDQTIVVWDAVSCEPLLTLRGHRRWVQKLVYLTEETLISSSTDGSVKIWDIASRQCLATLMPPRVYEGTDFRGATGLSHMIEALSYLGGRT